MSSTLVLEPRRHGGAITVMTLSTLCLISLASPSLARDGGPSQATTLDLPAPRKAGTISVEASIAARRSRRSFADIELDLAQVSQLLWSAQGITSPTGQRAAPSAGALYPLEVVLVAGRVRGLEPGTYRYLPKGHSLLRIAAGDVRRDLARAAVNQSWVAAAPAVLVIAGVVDRTAVKYGGRAARYVHMEAGAAAENVYLQCGALGLATVLVGAFDDAAVRRVTRLGENERPFAILPVGAP